jgi:phosphoenolpyruvate phosphomutase
MAALREAFASQRLIRIAGTHDGLSAMLAERHGFDSLWASGLGISTSHGVPDTSILTMTELLAAAVVMHQATCLPVIADCDTGFGEIDNVVRMIRCYEAAGIAGVCIEDKQFPKRNSFLGRQELADAHEFAQKVTAAKEAQINPDLVVIARVEALIAGASMNEALDRARNYAAAGADAILIHSKLDTVSEVREFAMLWHGLGERAPLVVVPTTYPSVTAGELEALGVRAAIYANQALRAAVRAIDRVLASIVGASSAQAIDAEICALKEVFELVVTDDPARQTPACDPLKATHAAPHGLSPKR